jgi:hypothetical protein
MLGKTIIQTPEPAKEVVMRKHLGVTLLALLALVLVWMGLGSRQASGAGIQYMNLAAPSFMGHDQSVHNGIASDACGSAVPLAIGDENKGDLQNGKGSFIQFVRFPDRATVQRFRLFVNDNDNDFDSHVYLIRKRITNGLSPAKSGYLVMAAVHSSGAVLDTLRRFGTASIKGATIDNTRFMYYVELVNCATTVEPFAIQIVYS